MPSWKKIDKQTEDIGRGACEDMGELKKIMDKLGKELKQGLDTQRKETNEKFETVDTEIQEQCKDIEILKQRMTFGGLRRK